MLLDLIQLARLSDLERRIAKLEARKARIEAQRDAQWSSLAKPRQAGSNPGRSRRPAIVALAVLAIVIAIALALPLPPR